MAHARFRGLVSLFSVGAGRASESGVGRDAKGGFLGGVIVILKAHFV